MYPRICPSSDLSVKEGHLDSDWLWLRASFNLEVHDRWPPKESAYNSAHSFRSFSQNLSSVQLRLSSGKSQVSVLPVFESKCNTFSAVLNPRDAYKQNDAVLKVTCVNIRLLIW